ncbi:MAG: aminotransferase class III-fold pyridoxal phosphate-dependent enzyme [Acidimicrobiales bacterium]
MTIQTHTNQKSNELRERARAVIPGGMYGHQNVALLPDAYPQFMASGRGARITDVDGNEYVDLMCSYGPVVLGHHHAGVERAAAAQRALADCQNGPSDRMVELAEAMVATVAPAQWAMFQKNGTDATTLCCTIARAASERRKILVASGAYHGAAPWCTPRMGGVTPEDRANLGYFHFNDLESVIAAADEAGDDFAGIVVSPFRHDAGFDQELVDLEFARGVRALCDQRGAALILDDVRCGFRLHLGSSWEPLGVDVDLSAWSKAIANGYPLACVTGNDAYKEAATTVYTTGSFWFSAVAMAASLATIEAIREEGAIDKMRVMGEALRRGLDEQAEQYGVAINQTGPVQMPYLTFDDDGRGEHRLGDLFANVSMENGLYLHPRHNWFVSAAMTEEDLGLALRATERAFAAVAAQPNVA